MKFPLFISIYAPFPKIAPTFYIYPIHPPKYPSEPANIAKYFGIICNTLGYGTVAVFEGNLATPPASFFNQLYPNHT